MDKSTSKLVLVVGLLTVVLGVAYLFAAREEKKQEPQANQQSQEIAQSQDQPKDATEANGKISGSFTYPGEKIPSEMAACVENAKTKEKVACSDEQIKDNERFIYGAGYEISVPVGEYYVYVDQGSSKAYYNGYMADVSKESWPEYDSNKCKTEYQPLLVTVEAGKTTENVTLADWYFETECQA